MYALEGDRICLPAIENTVVIGGDPIEDDEEGAQFIGAQPVDEGFGDHSGDGLRQAIRVEAEACDVFAERLQHRAGGRL